MGYYSNGTEGELYEEKYCSKCYWGDKACAVWLAHMLHNYKECNKSESFLDIFIPRVGLENKKCKMWIDKKLLTPTPHKG